MYKTISSKDSYLRPYQQEAKDNIFKAWDNADNVMLQMPTGTGKTVLFSSIIKDIHNWMMETAILQKVLIIVHRTELIEQTKDKLGLQYHVASGVIAGNYDRDLRPQVQIASIQTLTHPTNELLAQSLKVGFIIIDEAHHALAATYQKLWSLYPGAKKLGVTATPWRMNHAGFTDLFDELVQSWSIRKFIDEKYLAHFQYYSIRPTSTEQIAIDNITEFDIDGDFKVSALEKAMNNSRIRANLIDSYQKYAKGKKGIIYAISRSHGQKICKDYQDLGINVDYIDSKTKPQERKEKVEKFRSGKIEVLVNVDIFSEGFDCPSLDFVQLARPTKSLVKYLQQVGRALRPNGNKKAIILDNVGMFKRFGLPDAKRKWLYHFMGYDKEQKESLESNETDYPNSFGRYINMSEGSEEMVLLNEEIDESQLEKETEEQDPVSFSKLMEEKLEYLGIPHGIVSCNRGLFYDFVDMGQFYKYRQISIKHQFRYKELLIIPKDSILGKLCLSLGPNFYPNVQIDKKGEYYFEGGISYHIGTLDLCVNDNNELCKKYDENNSVPSLNEQMELDYDISKYNSYLQDLINLPQVASVKKYFNGLINSRRLNIRGDFFYLEDSAYILLMNDKKATIKKLVPINDKKIKSIQVACASYNSCLYRSCNKKGTDVIKYIHHAGGHFSTIIFEAEDGTGIYIHSFDGEQMSSYYDFEIDARYQYAKSIDAECASDNITDIELIDVNTSFSSSSTIVPTTRSSIQINRSKKKEGFDTTHKLLIRQKDGGYSWGYFNPQTKQIKVLKGCKFPVSVSESFTRNAARDLLISICSKKQGDFYETTEDYIFDSPSTAACIIKGYSANGMIEWKSPDGKIIKQLF